MINILAGAMIVFYKVYIYELFRFGKLPLGGTLQEEFDIALKESGYWLYVNIALLLIEILIVWVWMIFNGYGLMLLIYFIMVFLTCKFYKWVKLL